VVVANEGGSSDLGDAAQSDPEVRVTQVLAVAARTRLADFVTAAPGILDVEEARRRLDEVRSAQVFAEDAQDRFYVHKGLLTQAEAERRADGRRAGRPHGKQPPPYLLRRDLDPAEPQASLGEVARAVATVLIPAAAGVVGGALARRFRPR
jgi:hypothetical protein